MPPIFGLFILAVLALVALVVCGGPLLAVWANRRWRSRRVAWVVAGTPLTLVVLAGLSCAVANVRDSWLLEAVERGDAKEVRRLLESGVSADARTAPYDPYGSPTVIHTAINDRRWDIVKLLIDHGATDTYYGDDTMVEQTAGGLLDQAGQERLAQRLRRTGPPHF